MWSLMLSFDGVLDVVPNVVLIVIVFLVLDNIKCLITTAPCD